MPRKSYVSPYKDKGFRKWLRDAKNIDDRVLLALGTSGTIGSYRREYKKSKKR